MNTLKTALLLTSLTLLMMFVGGYFGGQNGMVLAFLLAAVMNFVSYFFSDKIALAMYRAQPATQEQLPRVYSIVEQLASKQGLPVPKIYLLPTESPNAFATGRNPKHASVAVTAGILDPEMTGNPHALARALQKIDAYSRRLPMDATPSTAHLFISAPRLRASDLAGLFSTHPPMEKRVERLIGRERI
ncbi:M48 family metalloprotease [Terriglobus sp. YAF25]|uniref:M48 family metalloprotease n=1 Tax=Terriglobus sp. YAF25 TaxID=3233080 RepID=UPI003F947F55